MKNLKKLSVILLVISLMTFSFLIAGCSSEESGGSASASTSSETSSESTPSTDSESSGLQTDFKFASMTVGGSWYIYGVTIADLMKEAIPNSIVDVLPYQGGIGNPILVSGGEADLGLSFSSSQNWAYNGILDYEGKDMTNLRALIGGLSLPYRVGIIIRDDLGIDSIQDIIDNQMKIRLLTVQKGGLGEAMARQVLEAYGISYEDIESYGGTVNNVELSVAVNLMKDGQADVFIHNISYKQPDFVEMCLRGGLTMIPIDDEQRTYLADKYGHIENVTVEPGEFVGTDEEVVTVGYPTGVIASDRMSEETAYAIVKSVCENLDKLKAAHASLADFDPAKAGLPEMNGYIPLHPGAEKYYREMGYIK
ncbi:TAXI family TRAP transporter solute-binding subunit [Fusibacter paucivorans]|uniref:TAXI family TRAP transporter solute-binding subunit n=1 Tax=Fusibacter paucivorans TaxID=76009 RepID=A0ABS5PLZ2_9FIRM|nr:TAXI family TRAP transporter solute-binding subunit [Fusibacter paucivorans]MBS7526184.1 TAXI family TRAP transporter solute-binding subunit [Fusibacter paucivorans]